MKENKREKERKTGLPEAKSKSKIYSMSNSFSQRLWSFQRKRSNLAVMIEKDRDSCENISEWIKLIFDMYDKFD